MLQKKGILSKTQAETDYKYDNPVTEVKLHKSIRAHQENLTEHLFKSIVNDVVRLPASSPPLLFIECEEAFK